MNVLVFPFGSAGDVHPLVGLSQALQARGHRVTIACNNYFQSLVERSGLDYVEMGTKEEMLEVARHPDLWHPMRAWSLMFREGIARLMGPQYTLITERWIPGQTVVVANCLGFGARIAQEKLGVPLVTVHLQPAVLWSAHESPALPGIASGRLAPRWLKRLQYWAGEKFVIDRASLPETNRFRSALGLPPIRHATRWWHSPNSVLCLFPEWFAPRQPDWPANVHHAQFPLWDESAVTQSQPEVERFLRVGPPPVVFTPGTGNLQAAAFFKAAAEACVLLNRRGMFLTPFNEQVPHPLPEGVVHFDYVPFSRVLPLAAALVHHGGIGTSAQGLRAGIPQLAMPLSHDQPDNAARLKRLGVADWLNPKDFRGPKVAAKLNRLLTSTEVLRNSRQASEKFAGVDAFEQACRVVERVGRGVE